MNVAKVIEVSASRKGGFEGISNQSLFSALDTMLSVRGA